MAGNLVKNRVCNTCGAEIRPQALFCYNCGSSVAPEIAGMEKTADGETGEKLGAAAKPAKNSDDNFDRPIEKPTTSPAAVQAEKKSAVKDGAKLKSAAALREKARLQQQSAKKTIEVVWAEPENAPNAWFLVAALVLVIFVAGILLTVLYLR